MIAVQLQKEIEASPEIIFDLLADHTQFPKWDPTELNGYNFIRLT